MELTVPRAGSRPPPTPAPPPGPPRRSCANRGHSVGFDNDICKIGECGGSAPYVVTGGCVGCGGCLLTCPEHAIRPHDARLVVRADRCSGCGECVEVCPVDAVQAVPAPDPCRLGGEVPA